MRKPHTELKNIHKDEDIWVIGAGASMNYIDPSFFDGKIVIGVNRVCRFFRCDYVVSKDARGFEELGDNLNGAKLILSRWESGNPKSLEPPSVDEILPSENVVDYEHYFFTHPRKPNEQPTLDCVGTEDIVVSYSSITSAIHLAAYMGSKNIILCGHDCGMIDGQVTIKDYYKNIKPVQGSIRHYHHWLKTQIEKHTINLKTKIKEVYGANVLSINPFINLGLEGHKYDRQGVPVQQDTGKKVKGVKVTKNKNYSSIEDLVRTVKQGKVNERMSLVYDKHLFWLLPYVEKLGKAKMVECGVARGGCIACCSKVNPELQVIGLDSWEPMPDFTEKDDEKACAPWKNSSWGTKEDVYKSYDKLQASTDKLLLLKGWFEDTIPNNINLFNDLDVLRIDSDYYESVKCCLDSLYDKVKPGGLIIFDDWYFNLKGVSAAANDFFDSRNIKSIEMYEHDKRGPTWFFKPEENN